MNRGSVIVCVLAALAVVSATVVPTLEAQRSRYVSEPSSAEVVAAARRFAQAEPRRAAEVAGRARWRGLVPSVRVGARRGHGLDSSSVYTSDLDRTNLSRDDSFAMDASITFDLGRLVFAREEVALLREARAFEVVRRQLLARVIELYFERRRLMLERERLGTVPLEHHVAIMEATALLDALTDHRFRDRWAR